MPMNPLIMYGIQLAAGALMRGISGAQMHRQVSREAQETEDAELLMAALEKLNMQYDSFGEKVHSDAKRILEESQDGGIPESTSTGKSNR